MELPLEGLDAAQVAEQFGGLPAEVQVLALCLGMLLSRCSRESRANLHMALAAHNARLKGDLVLRLPARAAEHVIVKFVGGGLSGL